MCFTGLNKVGNWEGEVEKEQVAEQRSGEKKKLRGRKTGNWLGKKNH